MSAVNFTSVVLGHKDLTFILLHLGAVHVNVLVYYNSVPLYLLRFFCYSIPL